MIARRKHGWIGIDFGAKAVKIAQLERAGDGLRCRRTVLACSAGKGGFACTGHQLRKALDVHGGFQGRLAACALPMSATELRTISLPPASDAECRAMIAQELEASATDESFEFDYWQPAVRSGNGEQEGLHVVSLHATKAAELMALLDAAGLECAVLDALPCALARAVSMGVDPTDDGPVAAIDWGHASATLVIVERSRAQFTRSLRDCGAGLLFNEIGQTLGIDEADSIELLTRFGLPAADDADADTNDLREVAADILGRHLQRVVDELVRTIAFLRLQKQTLIPTRAVLFGAGATVKNMAPFLATKTELPCELWRPAASDDPETSGDSNEIYGAATALSALAWKS